MCLSEQTGFETQTEGRYLLWLSVPDTSSSSRESWFVYRLVKA